MSYRAAWLPNYKSFDCIVAARCSKDISNEKILTRKVDGRSYNWMGG